MIFFVVPIVFGLISYAVIAVWRPEWVGITGKVAKKNIAEHKQETKVENHE